MVQSLNQNLITPSLYLIILWFVINLGIKSSQRWKGHLVTTRVTGFEALWELTQFIWLYPQILTGYFHKKMGAIIFLLVVSLSHLPVELTNMNCVFVITGIQRLSWYFVGLHKTAFVNFWVFVLFALNISLK